MTLMLDVPCLAGTSKLFDAEVDRVQAKALRQFDVTFNDPQRLGIAMSESIALGDWRLFFLQRDRWRQLKAAGIKRCPESIASRAPRSPHKRRRTVP